jgi:hypothetical protein
LRLDLEAKNRELTKLKNDIKYFESQVVDSKRSDAQKAKDQKKLDTANGLLEEYTTERDNAQGLFAQADNEFKQA